MSTLARTLRHGMFLTGLFSITMLLAGCSTSTTTIEPQSTNVIVYEGARVIVGDGSESIENGAFIVDNDRFTEVGRAGQLQVPAGARRVDLNGKTVMPAVIDTHKHLINGQTTRETLIGQLEHLAYYGVGTAVDLGRDRGEMAFQVREEIIPNAARLRTAGSGISAPEAGRDQRNYWVTSEQEVRKAVQELAGKHVDLVKIWVDDREGLVRKLDSALYSAVIDEAHKHNLRVTAHVYTLADAKGLLRAGIDAFAHKVGDGRIDEETINLFKQRPNVFLVPAQFGGALTEDVSWLTESETAEALQQAQTENRNRFTDKPGGHFRQDFTIWADNLMKLHAAGVRLAFGSDSGYPWGHHVEMADMVKAGIPPAEVITAATGNSAELLRLKDVGTIQAGKSADFMVLDANPLVDITNTRRISAVYLRGKEVDRAPLKARWMSVKPGS